MDFPLPDFGADIETILGYAVDWLDLINSQNFLQVLVVFSLVITVTVYIVGKIRNPPALDI